MTPKISPGMTSKRHAVDGLDRAVGLLQVGDLEHRAGHRCTLAELGRGRGARRRGLPRLPPCLAGGRGCDSRPSGSHIISITTAAPKTNRYQPCGEAQPLGQQHADGRAEQRAEEVARAADDDHQVHHDRRADGERRRLDELDQRREQRAGDAGVRPRRSRTRAACRPVMLTPRLSARIGLSRSAVKALPQGERSSHHSSAPSSDRRRRA